MSNPDVLVLGDANPDLVLRGADVGRATGQREVLVGDSTLTVGGSGGIFACGAARLGLAVAFVGVLGDDLFGRYMADELQTRGIDVSAVAVRPDLATGISVVLSSPADRGIYTAAGSTAALRRADIDDALVTSARHVHVASYYLQEALRPDLPSILGRAREAGATTSLDPNWDPAERWDGGLLDVLEHVDVFLPNAAEATRIAATDDVEDAARRLCEHAGVVVVKLGSAGALACRDGEIVRAGGFETEVVDTTGAGDAFDAGFVLALLNGWPLERSLAFANACGALSCRGVGGVAAQPTLDEALELVDRAPLS